MDLQHVAQHRLPDRQPRPPGQVLRIPRQFFISGSNKRPWFTPRERRELRLPPHLLTRS
jgi:hypothetical protein